MKLLQIHPSDTVAVAVEAIEAGSVLTAGGYTVTAAEPIPAGHKIALRDIPAGENVIKYACPIGHAATDIPAGSHVHTQNVKSNLSGQLSYTYTPDGKMLKVCATEVAKREGSLAPCGTVLSLAGGKIEVACGTGSVSILSVLPEGKKRMAAADFINGRKIAVGDVLTAK